MCSASSHKDYEKPEAKTFFQLPKHKHDILRVRKSYPSAFLGVRNATDL